MTQPIIRTVAPWVRRLGDDHPVARWLWPGLAYAVGFTVFFRSQIGSALDAVFGDRGDTRLMVFLHEHVFRSLLGHASFLSPPMFFNQPGTLGYSDAFLLNQLFYAPLRLLGIGPYPAVSLTIMALSLIGYFSLYALLRRVGGVMTPVAAVAALLFIFPNNLFLTSNHGQLFAVYYLPLVCLCFAIAIMAIDRSLSGAIALVAAGSLTFSLLFSTGFYIAWFFGFALLGFVPLALALAGLPVRDWIRMHARRIAILLAVAAAAFAVGMIPFVAIYIPVLKSVGPWHFGSYLANAPRLNDILNVGHGNLWTPLVLATHILSPARMSGTEMHIALTPTVQLLTVAAFVLALRRRGGGPRQRLMRAATIAAVAVAVLLLVVTVRIGHDSLFRLLFAAVPGASAIRAGYRGMLVANLFAALAIALMIDGELTRAKRAKPAAVIVMFLALALALAEQVNVIPRTFVSGRYERARLAQVPPAPAGCRSFYVLNTATTPRAHASTAIDAMWAALKTGVPTINGYSGKAPPGWRLEGRTAAQFEQRVRTWEMRRGITSGVCRLAWNPPAWKAAPLSVASSRR